MPRPQRCRRICQAPTYDSFEAAGNVGADTITLSLDEYEVVRLVDFEKKTHEQCAAHMDIARSTVTEIYESARFKLADCIVNGKRLSISGGSYRFCNGSAGAHCGKHCRKKTECSNNAPTEHGCHKHRHSSGEMKNIDDIRKEKQE